MKHLKPLYEYEEDEIMDLLGDLEKVGHGPMKGWIVQITNKHGLTTGEILIAEDWKEAQMIYDKNGTISGQGPHLASTLATMKQSSTIVSWDISDGFRAKRNVRGYKKWDMANPYTNVEVLDGLFTNARDILKNASVNGLMIPPGISEIKEV
jgi:hypothetical protein